MSGLASKSQLRMSFLRWAIVTVPAVLFLGAFSGRLGGSADSRWYKALIPADLVLPGWVFGAVWTTLYIMMGIALAMILHARGARGRGIALTLFFVQLVMNLAWSPLFFGAHQVTLALFLIIAMFFTVVATTFAFARIRKLAAWLLVPYMAWLTIATFLNYQIDQRNPNAETLVPGGPSTQITL